jgi:ATP-dependent DNA helicase PIF1
MPQPPEPLLPDDMDNYPTTAYSGVPNLQTDATEADIILQELGLQPPPSSYGLPAPSVRLTPIDEASGKERILSMAFPTLYPTGVADFFVPRQRSVTLPQYAEHLMRYRDGRFAKHPRWRFYIFNIIMRQRARKVSGFYTSKQSGLKNLSREDLATAFQENKSLLQQVVRQGSSLTGTRPFWRAKASGLLAQAHFLSPGSSPVFVTLSCADMQWHDLQRHLPRFTDYTTGDPKTRQKIVWDNIQNNPYIVAYYLTLRLQAFLKFVLKPYLGYTDHWNRYEWQARGSGHSHGLYWVPDAPSLLTGTSTESQRAAFTAY